jgi:FkbM family methyltransferase
MASVYVLTYKNRNYDMTTNGEYFVLDCLSKQNIKTVFDVGANKGEYTTACLSRFLDAKIHAFEIVPATFQKLAANIKIRKRVELNGFGLSNFEGTVEINYNPNEDGFSSIIAGEAIHDSTWTKLQVLLVTTIVLRII